MPAYGYLVVAARRVPGNAACGTPRRPRPGETDAVFTRDLAHQLNHVLFPVRWKPLLPRTLAKLRATMAARPGGSSPVRENSRIHAPGTLVAPRQGQVQGLRRCGFP